MNDSRSNCHFVQPSKWQLFLGPCLMSWGQSARGLPTAAEASESCKELLQCYTNMLSQQNGLIYHMITLCNSRSGSDSVYSSWMHVQKSSKDKCDGWWVCGEKAQELQGPNKVGWRREAGSTAGSLWLVVKANDCRVTAAIVTLKWCQMQFSQDVYVFLF